MYGLLLRLSALDAGAESAVRLISFFDALLEQGAPIETLMKSTAALAECPVGIRTVDGHLDQSVDPSGRTLHRARPDDAVVRRLSSGDEVWLERPGTPMPLDDLLLERYAITCRVTLDHSGSAMPELGDPALLELIVSSAAGEVERSRALHLLGIGLSKPLHLLAVDGSASAVDRIKEQMGGSPAGVRVAPVGRIHLIVSPVEPRTDLCVPIGARLGVAVEHPAIEAPRAWREARTALRFTLPSVRDAPLQPDDDTAIVYAAGVGGFALLVEHVPVEAMGQIPDVQVLEELERAAGGQDLLRTLEAVSATESLRKAASILHLHHNSVAHRVARAEEALGFSVTEPYGRARMMLALVLLRLRSTAAQE